jgi:hypothetical protein
MGRVEEHEIAARVHGIEHEDSEVPIVLPGSAECVHRRRAIFERDE